MSFHSPSHFAPDRVDRPDLPPSPDVGAVTTTGGYGGRSWGSPHPSGETARRVRLRRPDRSTYPFMQGIAPDSPRGICRGTSGNRDAPVGSLRSTPPGRRGFVHTSEDRRGVDRGSTRTPTGTPAPSPVSRGWPKGPHAPRPLPGVGLGREGGPPPPEDRQQVQPLRAGPPMSRVRRPVQVERALDAPVRGEPDRRRRRRLGGAVAPAPAPSAAPGSPWPAVPACVRAVAPRRVVAEERRPGPGPRVPLRAGRARPRLGPDDALDDPDRRPGSAARAPSTAAVATHGPDHPGEAR